MTGKRTPNAQPIDRAVIGRRTCTRARASDRLNTRTLYDENIPVFCALVPAEVKADAGDVPGCYTVEGMKCRRAGGLLGLPLLRAGVEAQG